jgi:hypothetical protein
MRHADRLAPSDAPDQAKPSERPNMANTSLQQLVHPLESISLDHPVAFAFELADPFLMSLIDFDQLIRDTEDPSLRGYLWGLRDQRAAAIYSGSPH